MPDGTAFQAEVAIVGAGAAGITLAQALAAAGIPVCLVEGGGLEPDAEAQALHDVVGRGYPLRENYMPRVRQLGGSCNRWAGSCMRLLPEDFAPRAWVPWSGWPIAPDEVERHIPEAARLLGLPDARQLLPDTYREGSSAAERRLYDRGDTLRPTVSLWAVKPMRFGQVWRRRLERAATLQVLLHANADHLDLDEAGNAVRELRVATLDGKRHTVVARRFVLAAGGLENARLLLVSNDRQPAGIGNAHDLVGRFFMDHPRAVFGKVRLKPHARLRLLRGVPLRNGKVQLGVTASPAVQARERLLNHYLTFESEQSGYAQERFDAAVQVAKVVLKKGHAGSRLDLKQALATKTPGLVYLLTPKEIVPHWAYRALHRLRELRPRPATEQRYVVVYFCEQPPDPASRVLLDRRHDRLGLPRTVLDWRIGPEVVDSVVRLQNLLAAELEAAGLGSLEPGNPEAIRFTDASHHMGTTRMSDDPRTGVVDRDGRVHGVANLYLAGSSVFPCAGHANPTLTIVALALRLARHLAEPGA